MLCPVNTITTTSCVGPAAVRTTVRLWGFVVRVQSPAGTRTTSCLTPAPESRPVPRGPAAREHAPPCRSPEAERSEDSNEPPDVKAGQQSSQDGGPHLLLLA